MLQGKYLAFTEEDLSTASIITDAMFASLSTVGWYPPAEVLGSSFIEGAAVWDLDIPAAVNYCKSLGYADKDITLDVVMTVNKKLVFEDTSAFNSL